jgi:NAD(P)-dependent dehydrogenase (short-subunit alcohol dehydrogenase family)
MHSWSEKDIPDQRGRTAVVTGSTSGLGLRVAEVLALKGARVVITARDAERGARALARVSDAASGPVPELVDLDLTDLSSVARAADAIRSVTDDRIDLLVNNAGIMARRNALETETALFQQILDVNLTGHQCHRSRRPHPAPAPGHRTPPGEPGRARQ